MRFRRLPFYSRLRSIKNNTVDLYRMQRYCGTIGRFLSVLQGLPFLRTRRQRPAPSPATLSESRTAYDYKGTAVDGLTSRLPDGGYPQISIVTPILKPASSLEACFRSVIDQNYPALEYIVIDCINTKDSIALINRYDRHINHRLSKPLINDAQAINEGLKHATGTIFNWLFPDDRLEPNALFNCAEAFLENQESAAWVGAVRRVRPDGSPVEVVHPNGLEWEHLLNSWNNNQFSQSSCFLDTLKTRSIGALDDGWAIVYDLDLWIRLLKKWNFSVGKGVWSKTLMPGYVGKHPFSSRNSEWAKLKEHVLPACKKDRLYDDRLSPQREPRFDQLKLQSGRADTHDRRPTIAVIGYSLPRFDKTSSEFRLHKIIQILLDCNCKVDYFYGASTNDEKKYKRSFKGDIRFVNQPFQIGSYLSKMIASNFDVIWISELWRISYIEFIVQLVKEIKSKQPDQKLIIDTVDFHFKEFQRKYQQSGNLDDLALANRYLKFEKQLYPLADVVTVVTQEEKNDVLRHMNDINRIDVIPNIHDLSNEYRPLAKRRNICFLGNFGTAHNADAVRYFLNNIFDDILKNNPLVEFHVLGFQSEKYRKAFKHPNVRVVGAIKNMHKALGCYRLFVCPLTYGAGMKGKIGDAMVAGTPIVTTTLGAEGMPVKDGDELFISDLPEEFAEKCNQCLKDQIVWNRFSIKAKKFIVENYSSTVVARKLETLLSL